MADGGTTLPGIGTALSGPGGPNHGDNGGGDAAMPNQYWYCDKKCIDDPGDAGVEYHVFLSRNSNKKCKNYDESKQLIADGGTSIAMGSFALGCKGSSGPGGGSGARARTGSFILGAQTFQNGPPPPRPDQIAVNPGVMGMKDKDGDHYCFKFDKPYGLCVDTNAVKVTNGIVTWEGIMFYESPTGSSLHIFVPCAIVKGMAEKSFVAAKALADTAATPGSTNPSVEDLIVFDGTHAPKGTRTEYTVTHKPNWPKP